MDSKMIALLTAVFDIGEYETKLIANGFSKEFLKSAIVNGFVIAKTDSQWGIDLWQDNGELYYHITSKGILEYNIHQLKNRRN